MVQADERSGFGQTVPLDDGEAKLPPEHFCLAVEGSTAGNESPELTAKLPVDVAKHPPAAEKVLALGFAQSFVKLHEEAMVVEIALDLFFERLQDPWDRDKH